MRLARRNHILGRNLGLDVLKRADEILQHLHSSRSGSLSLLCSGGEKPEGRRLHPRVTDGRQIPAPRHLLPGHVPEPDVSGMWGRRRV